LETLARGQGVTWGSHTELVQSPVVLRAFEAHIGKLNEELAPFERIKRFRLLDRELEHKSGEITPSMKVRRNVIAKTFADLIESMYAEPAGAGIGRPPTGATTEENCHRRTGPLAQAFLPWAAATSASFTARRSK
jgi:hypothetical protein